MKIRTLLLAGLFGLLLLPLMAQSPQEVSMYQTAEKSYLAGSYQNAFEQLNDYVRTYPSGAYILAAVYNRGNSLAMLKRYEEALSDYDYVVQAGNNPYATSASQRAQQVKDKMAQKQATASSTPPGSITLGNQTAPFSSTPTTSSSMSTTTANYQSYAERNPVLNAYFSAVSAFNSFNYGVAEPYLQTVINTDPGELGAEARFMQAKIAFIKGDFNRARDLSRAAMAATQAYPFWRAKSVLVMSDALFALNDATSSKTLLEGLVNDYNQDPAILAEARMNLARLSFGASTTTSSGSYPRPR